MTNNLSPKQFAFAGFIADGLSLKEAYLKSYNASGMKDGVIRTEASRLAKNPKVSRAIEDLRQDSQTTRYAKEKLTKDWLLERLRDEAQNDCNPASSRVRALELLGKSSGLFEDKTIRIQHRSAEEVEQELIARLDTLRFT